MLLFFYLSLLIIVVYDQNFWSQYRDTSWKHFKITTSRFFALLKYRITNLIRSRIIVKNRKVFFQCSPMIKFRPCKSSNFKFCIVLENLRSILQNIISSCLERCTLKQLHNLVWLLARPHGPSTHTWPRKWLIVEENIQIALNKIINIISVATQALNH